MVLEVARFTGETGRDLEIKGLLISASEYLEAFLPPVLLVGDEMEIFSRPEMRDGVTGVFATSERER
jgi:hypothetical protein